MIEHFGSSAHQLPGITLTLFTDISSIQKESVVIIDLFSTEHRLAIACVCCIAISVAPACDDSSTHAAMCDVQPWDASPTLAPSPVTVLASQRGTIGDLIVCGGSLIWSETDRQRLVRMPIDGGDPVVIPNTTVYEPNGSLFSDREAAIAYWVDAPTSNIMSLRCRSGATTEPTVVADRQNGVMQLFAHGPLAFWSGVGGIRRKRLPDGDIEVIATLQGAMVSMTAMDGLLYWASAGQQNVKTLPIDANATPPLQIPTVIAPHERNPLGIEVSDSTVYWLNDTDWKVESFERDGLGVIDISGGYSQWPFALAVSSSSVYWANDCGPCDRQGFILRTPRAHRTDPTCHGAVEVFASGEPGLGPLRVANGYVYWASDKAGGAISRRPE